MHHSSQHPALDGSYRFDLSQTGGGLHQRCLARDPVIEIVDSETDVPTVIIDDTTGPPEIKVTSDLTNRQKPTSAGRAKSDDLLDVLENIISRDSVDYIYNSKLGIEAPPPASASSLTVPYARNGRDTNAATPRQQPERQANTKNPYATPSALDIWNTHSDIIFAKGVFSNLDTEEVYELTPAEEVVTPLCEDCSNLETGFFSRSSFSKSFTNAYRCRLRCTLCAIMFAKMEKIAGKNSEKMLLREESSLTTARGEPPVLSIVVGPTEGKPPISLIEGRSLISRKICTKFPPTFREVFLSCRNRAVAYNLNYYAPGSSTVTVLMSASQIPTYPAMCSCL
jgi:hypothetical protein